MIISYLPQIALQPLLSKQKGYDLRLCVQYSLEKISRDEITLLHFLEANSERLHFHELDNSVRLWFVHLKNRSHPGSKDALQAVSTTARWISSISIQMFGAKQFLTCLQSRLVQKM